ncbi:MAG: hypothetical protein ACYS67_16250, partial [Planctomycetota bacterium]
VINPDSLLKTASYYGFDKQWLHENVPAAKYAQEKPTLSRDGFSGLKTFEEWFKSLDEAKGLEPPSLIYSYDASVYLAETKSLIWFAVRDGKYDLTDEERAEVLALLQEEVTAAFKLQNDNLSPEDKPKSLCCEDKFQNEAVRVFIIYECEKALVEYFSLVSLTSK